MRNLTRGEKKFHTFFRQNEKVPYLDLIDLRQPPSESERGRRKNK
jgi:hypothetical protein